MGLNERVYLNTKQFLKQYEFRDTNIHLRNVSCDFPHLILNFSLIISRIIQSLLYLENAAIITQNNSLICHLLVYILLYFINMGYPRPSYLKLSSRAEYFFILGE